MIKIAKPIIPTEFVGHWVGNLTSVEDKWQMSKNKCEMLVEESGITATYELDRSTRRGQLIPTPLISSDQLVFCDRVIQSAELTVDLSLVEGAALKCVWRGQKRNKPEFVAVMMRVDNADPSSGDAGGNVPISFESRLAVQCVCISDAYFLNKELSFRAFNRFKELATGCNWKVEGEGGRLNLYFLSKQTFADRGDPSANVAAFTQGYRIITDMTEGKKYGYFGAPSEVFQTILRTGSGLLPQSMVNLCNLKVRPPEMLRINYLLRSLSMPIRTGPNQWMIISKLLNFINPGLFPVWDDDLIWRQVIGNDAPFRKEYEALWSNLNLTKPESSLNFLRTYTYWAASCIQKADSNFMNWFAEWMDLNYRAEIEKYQLGGDVASWCAAAFEFAIIGAASLEVGQ